MIEIACREAIFHFNKKFLEDPTIPMWTIKTKGQSYYVNHVDCQLSWSTKETPENGSTKGSIKFKNALLTINDTNSATLTPLKLTDISRLKAKSFTRIVFNSRYKEVKEFFTDNNIHHTEFKDIRGGCGNTWSICDIKKPNDITLMQLSITNLFRILSENDVYYKLYDDDKVLAEYDLDSGVNDEYDDTED